jgi:hypothetical protein
VPATRKTTVPAARWTVGNSKETTANSAETSVRRKPTGVKAADHLVQRADGDYVDGTMPSDIRQLRRAGARLGWVLGWW